jgi:6-phosphofructokinase 2
MTAIVTLTMNPALDIAFETDRVVPNEKLRCGAPRYDAGGGGINVARAIKLLGGDALAVFPVGGPSGAEIVDLLDASAIRHLTVPVDGSVRDNVHVTELATGRQFRFVMAGPTLSAEEQKQCLDAIAALRPAPRYLVASGSLPPGVPKDFYAQVIALAARNGTKVVLDTSGEALRAAGRGMFLLKPSLRELQDLAGRTLDQERDQVEALTALIRRGIAEIIVLSLGERGALLATAGETWRLSSIPVVARGTVGAGDSMVAGIVHSLERGWSLLHAVQYGVAAATAALMRSGTQLCAREDTERLYLQYAAEEGYDRRFVRLENFAAG